RADVPAYTICDPPAKQTAGLVSTVSTRMPHDHGNNSAFAPLRLGTRGSLLARPQSQLVADAIEAAHPGIHVELTIIKTSGDQIAERPLHEFGGKGLFTKELEQALLAGQIDLAVHSFKDVPVTMPLVDASD